MPYTAYLHLADAATADSVGTGEPLRLVSSTCCSSTSCLAARRSIAQRAAPSSVRLQRRSRFASAVVLTAVPLLLALLIFTATVEVSGAKQGIVLGVQCAYAQEAPPQPPGADAHALLQREADVSQRNDVAHLGSTEGESGDGYSDEAAADAARPFGDADGDFDKRYGDPRRLEEAALDVSTAEERAEGDGLPVYKGRRARDEFDMSDIIEFDPLFNPDAIPEEQFAMAADFIARSTEWPAMAPDRPSPQSSTKKYDASEDDELFLDGATDTMLTSGVAEAVGEESGDDVVASFGRRPQHGRHVSAHNALYYEDETALQDDGALDATPPNGFGGRDGEGGESGGMAVTIVRGRYRVAPLHRQVSRSRHDPYMDAAYAPSSTTLTEDETMVEDDYMVAGTGDKAGGNGPQRDGVEQDAAEDDERDEAKRERGYASTSWHASGPPSWSAAQIPSGGFPATSVAAVHPSHAGDVLAGSPNERDVRSSVLNSGIAVRDGLSFDMKRQVQARWREYRRSYPTLRELIRQLVDAYKEEQRVKRACASVLATTRRRDKKSCGNATRVKEAMSAAECAAELPRLRTSLDWVRYLPYVPIYPIDEAVKHLEHEEDDDILLALFYAPDLFNTYNYIQWMSLMVKATCSLLRAGAMEPLTNIRDSDFRDGLSAANATENATAHEREVFCPNLVLPSINGLLDPEDVHRLRANAVRIAIIDGYYPQRNVSRKLWEHIGTDTYMVKPEEWDVDYAGTEDSGSSNKASSSFFPTANPPTVEKHLPISDLLQRSSEDWGPMFVEQRNALLRLLAHEGGLFKEVQEALQPTSRPWRGDHEGPAGATKATDQAGREAALSPQEAQMEREETLKGWRADEQHDAEKTGEKPRQAGVETHSSGIAKGSDSDRDSRVGEEDLPTHRNALSAISALNGNDRIQFLGRYIIEHTDDLILTRPNMLLEVLQRSFNRIRQREQRLVEKIFGWGQIMKYRLHVNVSAQRIDAFSSDHVCQVGYRAFLHFPLAVDGTSANGEVSSGSGGGGQAKPDMTTAFWKGEQRAQSAEAGDDEDDAEGSGWRASCYHYQQLRNSRTRAALGSVSGLQRRQKRRSAILAPATKASATPSATVATSKPSQGSQDTVREKDESADARQGAHESVATADSVRRLNHYHDDAATKVATDSPPQQTTATMTTDADDRKGEGVKGNVPAESPRHAQAHIPSRKALTPRYRQPHIDAAAAVGNDSDVEDVDEDLYFDEALSLADEQDGVPEVYVQYTDGIDEVSLEEDEEAGRSLEGGIEDSLAGVGETHDSTSSAGLSDSASDGSSSSRIRSDDGETSGSASGSSHGSPGESANSLLLLGAAARRNYLLRQNPPVLLFPRKQGSRPYMFPQTLLQLVHLSFSGAHGQLPPREHAQRLRRRWGCEEPPSGNGTSGDEGACSASYEGKNCACGESQPYIDPTSASSSSLSCPSSCCDNLRADPHVRKSRESSSSPSAPTPGSTPPYESFAGTSSPMSPPTPLTYRVVSTLDNPFSRIGVEHLHYDFVISGPSSPTAVLQLLVEEARRVSTPGELATRSHREALYRLQRRRWLEAQQKHPTQGAKKQPEQRAGGSAEDAGCADSRSTHVCDVTAKSNTTNTTAGGTNSSGCAARAVSNTDNGKEAPNRPASCVASASSAHCERGTTASTLTKSGEEPTSLFERLPQAELAEREYGHSRRTWGERILASTAKDLNAYLTAGKAATEAAPPDEKHDGNAARRPGSGSDEHAAQEDEAEGCQTSSQSEAAEETYFFEHDISFRLDPDRFVENAPLTLHFFLRTPTHVIEAEIIEPLKKHIRVLRQRLIEDILADVYQYSRCQISGNRFVQLLRRGADGTYVNGTRISPPTRDDSVRSSSSVSSSTTATSTAGSPTSPSPALPYAYTEEGLPLLRCVRNSAAIWVWRSAAEMQAEEIKRFHVVDNESDLSSSEAASSGILPVPLPRDAVSYLELLHMPYDTTMDAGVPSEEIGADQSYSDTMPLANSRFNPERYSEGGNTSAANLTASQRARLQEQCFAHERFLLIQLAFRELMKRSSPGSTDTFFQLVTIDREAAMPVRRDDPSRVVHRTLPSSITSSSSLPVAGPERVTPRACLTVANNTYMVVTYLFFNATAERHFREHPLNRRRVRLMQRLDEAVRLSRQARLILLTATEDDYNTQYLDSIIQDAARRFYVIRQISRNRDTAARDWEVMQQQQQRLQEQQQEPQDQQEHDTPFSALRRDPNGMLVPSNVGATARREGPGPGLHWLHPARSEAPGASSFSSAGVKGEDASVRRPDSTKASPSGDASDNDDEEEEEEDPGRYDGFTHLSPFQFNIINYDFDDGDDDALLQQPGVASTAKEPATTSTTAFLSTAATSVLRGEMGETAQGPDRHGAAPLCEIGDSSCIDATDSAMFIGHSVQDSTDVRSGSDVRGGENEGALDREHVRVLRSGRVTDFAGAGEDGATAATLSQRRKGVRGRWSWLSSSSEHTPVQQDGLTGDAGRADATRTATERTIHEEMAFLDEELRRLQRAHSHGEQRRSDDALLVESGRGSAPAPYRDQQQSDESSGGLLSRWTSFFFRHRGRGGATESNHHPTPASAEDVHAKPPSHDNARRKDVSDSTRAGIWQRQTRDHAKGNTHADGGADDYTEWEEFEQGDDEADMSHVITGEKTEYEEGLPFPWRHGELPQQELRRRFEEHQRHVRELKRRLIDVRLRWASALWSERERPGAGEAARMQQEAPPPSDTQGADDAEQQQAHSL